jgi:beta-galactosidase
LWGHPHETRPLAPQQADLEYMLSHGASVNIYMFHGGTSFGMMAGASQSTGSYRGNVTSYDYDAPLDEAGHTTPKFFAYRDILSKYKHEKPLPVPATPPVITIPEFKLTKYGSLWDGLPVPVAAEEPPTMEQIGQSYGYILYRKQLTEPVRGQVLALDHLQDFAEVFVDGKLVGTLDRHYHQDQVTLTTGGPARLDILVENTGRLNSTKAMRDERKGIRGAALAGVALTGWQVYSLPMASMPSVVATSAVGMQGPHFAAGSFRLAGIGDTFLDVRGLGKGVIWINGHALGRFWNIGPQGTLYVPGPWLKKGENEVVIFEMFGTEGIARLAGLSSPILDAPTPAYQDDPERLQKPKADAEFGPKLATPAAGPQ